MLQSITKITFQFLTRGSNPVLVLASDMQDYVCKYQRTKSADYSGLLVNEFIASNFLRHWKIECPEIAIIKVKPEHVNTNDLALELNWFELPCFGSLHNKYYREVDTFLSEGSRYQNKLLNYDDIFLKIALFDIWTCNEDRHQMNYNLMLDTTQNNKLIPIDHACIFNSNTIDHEPYDISFDESIISSPLLLATYRPKELSNQNLLARIQAYMYLCVKDCQTELPTILSKLPLEWCNDKADLYTKIEKKLFQDSWIQKTWQTFLAFLQFSENRIK